MLFSSVFFLLVFLPFVIIFYYLLKDRYRNFFLLLASLLFYSWGEPNFIILLLISIFMNYCFGLGIRKDRVVWNKLIVFTAVLANLGILGYFKYANFFIENLNLCFGSKIDLIKQLVLPIGISFYTFQALSYVVDVYRGATQATRNILDLGLYISFFPQLIAGPIVKYHDIAIQLRERTVNIQDFSYGIRRFSYGLAKKVLIANTVAMSADEIFSFPRWDAPLAWYGLLCYTLQIYFDFSGYSDMAIGLGRMFGFRFLENFNYPYTASSIREFWHRWHISLSTWFREYLYFPLGGSRSGVFRTYINLLLVFLATGIWHGASWNFIVWGLIHGLFIVLERLGLSKVFENRITAVFSYLYTLFVVMIAWVYFRADNLSIGWRYMCALFKFKHEFEYDFWEFTTPTLLAVLIIGVLLCGPVQRSIPKLQTYLYDEKRSYIFDFLVSGILISASSALLVANSYNPFIYFRF